MGLISTADLRSWLSLADGDKKPNVRLDSISDAIEDFVDSYCMRNIEAKRYNSDPHYTYLDGSGSREIYLPQYPVSVIYEVNIDADREFGTGTAISSDPADLIVYPNGKLISEGEFFLKGSRNVKIDYIAGYAPVVGGTHDALVSSYPLPLDLKQVMVEMTVETFKEGLTAIHTVDAGEHGDKIIRLLTQNSFWSNVLNKYKAFDKMITF